jgi:hypothetical protein
MNRLKYKLAAINFHANHTVRAWKNLTIFPKYTTNF